MRVRGYGIKGIHCGCGVQPLTEIKLCPQTFYITSQGLWASKEPFSFYPKCQPLGLLCLFVTFLIKQKEKKKPENRVRNKYFPAKTLLIVFFYPLDWNNCLSFLYIFKNFALSACLHNNLRLSPVSSDQPGDILEVPSLRHNQFIQWFHPKFHPPPFPPPPRHSSRSMTKHFTTFCSQSLFDKIFSHRYSTQTRIRWMDRYTRMLVDHRNLHETQSRAARRNCSCFWCMNPAAGPSSWRVQLSSRLRCDPFEWIHSLLSLWQAEGNGWGARLQQKRGGTSACTR